MKDMALEAADVEAIIGAVDEVVGRRLEQVYASIEQLREEFYATTQVLDGNDHAVVAEVQRMKQEGPAVLLATVEESWSHYIKGEAERLGMKVMVPKMPSAPVQKVEKIEVRGEGEE